MLYLSGTKKFIEGSQLTEKGMTESGCHHSYHLMANITKSQRDPVQLPVGEHTTN